MLFTMFSKEINKIIESRAYKILNIINVLNINIILNKDVYKRQIVQRRKTFYFLTLVC